MSMSPDVAWIGRLGGDFEIKFTNGGQSIASASLVVSERWLDKKTDEWQERSSWFRLTIWGEMGENAAQSLHKGDEVIVHGRVQIRKWETDEGETRLSPEITVNAIGPSLRKATVIVEKIEREKVDGAGVPYPSRAKAKKAKPAAKEEEPSYSDSDEPF